MVQLPDTTPEVQIGVQKNGEFIESAEDLREALDVIWPGLHPLAIHQFRPEGHGTWIGPVPAQAWEEAKMSGWTITSGLNKANVEFEIMIEVP